MRKSIPIAVAAAASLMTGIAYGQYVLKINEVVNPIAVVKAERDVRIYRVNDAKATCYVAVMAGVGLAVSQSMSCIDVVSTSTPVYK